MIENRIHISPLILLNIPNRIHNKVQKQTSMTSNEEKSNGIMRHSFESSTKVKILINLVM